VVLTVKERILLLSLLPTDGGSLAALRIKQQIWFSLEERDRISLKAEQADGTLHWTWDTSVPSEIDFHPSARQAVFLSDLMVATSQQGKLNDEMVPLFPKLYLPPE
jgi:hypothetical protein